MDLFSINGKFYSFMTKVADLIILSIFWLLCSLPVFTLGAASSALYYCVIKVIRQEEGHPISAFFRAFKENFKQSTVVTLAFIAVTVVVTLIGTAFYKASPSPEALHKIYIVYLVLLGVAIAWLHYLISYIARFRAPLMTVVKNSLAICFVNLPQSISMMVLFILCVVGFILTIPSSAMLIIIAPGLYALLTSYLTERIYRKYMPEEDASADEEA